MYSNYHLDTPPPQSQFRRPWSPEPFNPYPTSETHEEYDPWSQHEQQLHQQPRRREPSDVSVEALDLADYAMTLNPSAVRENRYPPFRGHDPYPPSPPSLRPLASRTSLATPSLVSSRGTPSLAHTPSSRSPMHRPFSLPPPARSRNSLSDSPSRHGHTSNYPYIASPPSVHSNLQPGAVGSEIDIAQFPAWSRNWYDSNNRHAPPSPYDDIPSSQYAAEHDPKLSPFDPGYSYPHSEPHSQSYHGPMSQESARDLLPWSGDPPSYGPPVDPEIKEERVRMLQREFGAKFKKGLGMGGEEDAERVVGSVDEKGQLVTQGPRKRSAVRVLQGLLALGSGASSIYGAVIIKPKSVPPPSGKLPAYVLYILSVITFLAMLYTFVFRPCCTGRRSSANSNLTGGMSGMPGMPGMMVLPVQGGANGKGKKGKKGKKGSMGPAMGDVQVNLIVDPGMLQGQQHEDGYGYEDEYDENSSIPGSYSPYAHAPSPTQQRRPRPRRSIFAGLAMEEQWRVARGTLKKLVIFDVIAFILWGAEFVLILIGKRCPSGGFEGWCNAYNVASAGACLLCVAFSISVFFDVKDLHTSKASPRTRP